MFRAMRFCLLILSLSAVFLSHVSANAFAGSSQPTYTINERLETRAIILFARPLGEERRSENEPEEEPFKIETILKGGSLIGMGDQIETKRLAASEDVHVYMIEGELDKDDPNIIHWSAAQPLSKKGFEYIESLPRDFDSPVARLAFFMEALEHDDPVILSNAHLEFAIAEDATLEALKDHMNRTVLREWIEDTTVTKSRKNLYFSMLGICGNEDDGEWIESKLLSEEIEFAAPALATWLLLRGERALRIIDDQTFSLAGMEDEIPYVRIYNAVVAVRYVAAKSEPAFARERIAESLRRVLDMPTLADLVILDLLALQDWQSIEQIVELYESEEEDNWCRVPAILFMRVCPLMEAKEHLERFKRLDEKSYQRAFTFYPEGNLDDYRSVRKPTIRPRGRHRGNFC